jgi:molybdenum cofactor guanylyltransferase
MGRDKTRLRLGRRTLLGHVRSTGKALGLPVRIIRHDLAPGCGPLGGIFTALKSCQVDAELFLACDMPFVSPALLAQLASRFLADEKPRFVAGTRGAGFPFILPRTSLEAVERHLERKQLSLQSLAKSLNAPLLRPSMRQRPELLNINTVDDLKKARRQWNLRARLNR